MIECPKCSTKNTDRAKFCESCGDSFEQFHELDDQLEEMLKAQARRGAWALGFVALINAVLPLVMGLDNWVTWTVAAIFGALAVWSMSAPLLASSIGLGLFGLILLLDTIAEPASLARGVLGRIIIFSVLINAVRAGLKHRAFQRERSGE